MTGPDPDGNRLSNHEPWIAVEVHLPEDDALTLLAMLLSKQGFRNKPNTPFQLVRDDGAFAIWGPTTAMSPLYGQEPL